MPVIFMAQGVFFQGWGESNFLKIQAASFSSSATGKGLP